MTSFDASAPTAILLAAGEGKRMGSDLPKVLVEVAGRPMLAWVIDACRSAGVTRIIVVVGYQAEKVRAAFADQPDLLFVEQTERLGTGHATAMARPLFEDSDLGLTGRDTFVLAGDGPLIRAHTLSTLLATHRSQEAAATLATAVIEDPSGYGRVLRNDQGHFDRIVEERDASPLQRAVREVNPSYYCFRSDQLFAALERVSNKNAQGEYYLTDVPALLQADGARVAVVDAVPADDVLSINTPQQLAEVDAILHRRRLH